MSCEYQRRLIDTWPAWQRKTRDLFQTIAQPREAKPKPTTGVKPCN